MLVNSIMLTRDKLVTVSTKASLKEALQLIEDNGFLSIPVVCGDKFYGAIGSERIYAFGYEQGLNKEELGNKHTVDLLMRTDLPQVDPFDNLEKAADLLAQKNVPFVAVVDENGIFKGILTHKIIFEQFIEIFGFNKGQRLSVIAFDIPGQISRLSRIISDNDGDILSFVVVDPKSVAKVKEIVMRVKTKNLDKIIKKIKDAGFKVG
jgi:acetoin utilization protein AcuB